MKKLTLVMWMLVSVPAMADHWISAREVVDSARRLDNRATMFLEHAEKVVDFRPFCQDARRLAKEADQFRDRVERGAGFQAVLAEYKQLQKSFDNMDDHFDKTFNHHREWKVRYLWLSVSYMFHKLDWAMTQGNDSLNIDLDQPGRRPGRPGGPGPGGPGPGGPRPGGPRPGGPGSDRP